MLRQWPMNEVDGGERRRPRTGEERQRMREETISGFLERLAARVPAPGGGAVAALHAAQSAALLGMVARYSQGPKYADHADVIDAVLVDADRLREHALDLAETDAAAFTAVTGAYTLPKDSEAQQSARSAAIAVALAEAARPPAAVVGAALRLVELAEDLLAVANRSVITDVAAAVEAARAAATTARVNVEVNLAAIEDSTVHLEFAKIAALVDDVVSRADEVSCAVRVQVTR
jgi:methenyltetrahydrofolate cyclohydrolase